MAEIGKATLCLMFDKEAQEAAEFYAATFPETSVDKIVHAPSDNPATAEGEVLVVEFTLMGMPCIGVNGGPHFKHSEAFSVQVATEDQEETDRLWNAIVRNGGQEGDCGWCKDHWGVSWQITPRALSLAMSGDDPGAARRAFEAMMTMQKIDVAAIEAACRGE